MHFSFLVPFLLIFLYQAGCAAGWPRTTVSKEHQLRQDLFSSSGGISFNRMIRPVLNTMEKVKVRVQVELRAVVDVDKNGQFVSTDTIIKQQWNNTFFMWTPSIYGGVEKLLVSPNEMWAPDIVLHNNADDNVAQAGYTEKFKTWIVIYHNGISDWISPVSFKSTCSLDVTYFPYDQHRCDMIFGSLTSDKTLLDIETDEVHLETRKGRESDEDGQFEEIEKSASWSIQRIEVRRKEHYRKGFPHPFTAVHLSFIIRRKPLHFVVFSMVPCMLIGALIFVSFFIPVESGERIGFSCTILLSVSVYLLIVTEALPEQSDSLPLIGVYYIIIMIEIALALTATIVVLKAHHATTQPPGCLKGMLFINNIYRCCRKPKRRKRTSKVEPPVQVVVLDYSSDHKEKHEDSEERYRKKSSISLSQLSVDSGSQLFTRPNTTDGKEEEEDWSETWRQIGKALDRLFFWTFTITFLISTVVVFTYGPSLAKPLNDEMDKLYGAQRGV